MFHQVEPPIKFKLLSKFFQRHFSFFEFVLLLLPKRDKKDFSGVQNTIIIIKSYKIHIASSKDTSVAAYPT